MDLLSGVDASVGSVFPCRTGDVIGSPGDGRPLTSPISTISSSPLLLPSNFGLLGDRLDSSIGIHLEFIALISEVIQKTIRIRHAATPILRLVLMILAVRGSLSLSD